MKTMDGSTRVPGNPPAPRARRVVLGVSGPLRILWRRMLRPRRRPTARELAADLARVHRLEQAALLDAAARRRLAAVLRARPRLFDLDGGPPLRVLRRALLAEYALAELDGAGAPPELEALAVQPLAAWPAPDVIARKAFALAPSTARRLALVRILLALGRPGPALEELERSWRARPAADHSAGFFHLLALARELADGPARASEAWRLAVGRGATGAEALVSRLACAVAAGSADDARAAARDLARASLARRDVDRACAALAARRAKAPPAASLSDASRELARECLVAGGPSGARAVLALLRGDGGTVEP